MALQEGDPCTSITIKMNSTLDVRFSSFPFISAWNNSKVLAELEDRQRMDAVRFREAGEGPIQKTYSYDPTKVKSKAAVQAKSK